MNSQQKEFLEIHNSIDFHKIKDHPNILIAANFWEPERYGAAKTCYKFMRTIDDHIDNYKAKHIIIAPEERKKFEKNVDEWLKLIIGSEEFNPVRSELIDAIEKFKIPRWPLEAFAKSMVYDINNDGFPTLATFLEYSQGASVAPASIFVHLSGLTSKNGSYHNPGFDVKESATPCAIFSYLVHIIRDFQKDQHNNLNYFADDMMIKNGLSREELRNIAYGGSISHGFRNMIRKYYDIADEYRQLTFKVIRKISPIVEPRYKLSLEIIFSLYLMAFEKIDIENGNFTAIELNPTPEETKTRVYETIMNFSL